MRRLWLVNFDILLNQSISTHGKQCILLIVQINTFNKRTMPWKCHQTIITHHVKHFGIQIRRPSEQNSLSPIQHHTYNSIGMPTISLDTQTWFYVVHINCCVEWSWPQPCASFVCQYALDYVSAVLLSHYWLAWCRVYALVRVVCWPS